MCLASASTDKVLQLILRNRYSDRSNFAFISCLPTELLESIFIQLACYHFWSDTCSSSQHLPDWVHVALVCSHWHNVALNCATLWSYITPSPLRWIEISLARSRRAPLKIRFNTGYQVESLVFVEKILKHVQRIEALFFHTSHWNAQISQIFATICSSASQLRTLVFSIDGYRDIDTPVPLDSFNLRGLTTLSLHSVPYFLRQSVLAFQAVLKCMPGLRHLHLVNALASARDFTPCVAFDMMQKIDLPCLSGLLIIAPFSTIIAFLSSTNIPASAEIKLWCKHEGDFSLHDCDRLCFILAPDCANGLVLPTIRSVVIEHDFRRVALAFSIFSRCDRRPSLVQSAVSSLTWGHGICLEIVVELSSTLYGSTLASRICVAMPTTNTQALHVIHPPFLRAFWREILGNLQRLQRIKLSNGCMPDELTSVLLPQIAGEIYGKDLISLSELEDLELVDIEFWAGHWSDSDSDREILVPALGLDSVSFWKRRAPYKRSTGGSNLGLPPFEELETLCTALSSRKGFRGRLTVTRCHLDSNHHPFLYDLTGKWEGGQFYVADMHCYPDARLEEFLEWTALWELGRKPRL